MRKNSYVKNITTLQRLQIIILIITNEGAHIRYRRT